MDLTCEVDLTVGILLQALDDRKLTKDTIIVFTSDNGGLVHKHANSNEFGHYSNGLLKGSKGSLYEGFYRIQLAMCYDSVFPSGKRSNDLVDMNDLLPTLSELVDAHVLKKNRH